MWNDLELHNVLMVTDSDRVSVHDPENADTAVGTDGTGYGVDGVDIFEFMTSRSLTTCCWRNERPRPGPDKNASAGFTGIGEWRGRRVTLLLKVTTSIPQLDVDESFSHKVLEQPMTNWISSRMFWSKKR